MRIGSLFSGYGGLDHAVGAFYDAEAAWVSDVDPGANLILAHRYPNLPNLGDITRVDWSQVEPVDILTGGFPCQDLSAAGKRAGLRPGTRSGLWAHMAYAISQLRPRVVVAENVRGLLSAGAHSEVEPCPWCVGGAADGEPDLRALGAVLGDLADLGFNARWVGLRAADIGAPHGRFRIFVVAADTRREHGQRRPDAVAGGYRQQGSSDRPQLLAATVADTERSGRDGGSGQLGSGRWPQPPHSGDTPADTTGAARGGTQPEHLGAATRPTPELGERPSTDWGPYTPAIARWERVLGRPAPAPTEASARGSQRLSPRFVEWMQGLPEGWVTDAPGLSRNAQLKALGNGVVPQQAYAALQLMQREVAA